MIVRTSVSTMSRAVDFTRTPSPPPCLSPGRAVFYNSVPTASQGGRPPCPMVYSRGLERARQVKEDVRSGGNLSVTDGFKFGCGLILAGIAFYFVLIILSALLFLIATIFQINIPIPVQR